MGKTIFIPKVRITLSLFTLDTTRLYWELSIDYTLAFMSYLCNQYTKKQGNVEVPHP